MPTLRLLTATRVRIAEPLSSTDVISAAAYHTCAGERMVQDCESKRIQRLSLRERDDPRPSPTELDPARFTSYSG